MGEAFVGGLSVNKWRNPNMGSSPKGCFYPFFNLKGVEKVRNIMLILSIVGLIKNYGGVNYLNN